MINPAWSPDGEQIAFHRVEWSESGIYVVPALGGPERKLVSTHAAIEASAISWSPDSKWDRFLGREGDREHHRLNLLAVGSLEITPIPHSEKCQEEVSPAFSRRGDQLAYLCILGTGGFGLYTVALPGGPPHQIGLYKGWSNGITWTSDDQRLVGSREVEGTEHDELYEVSVANGQLRALPFDESAEYPTISAKGDKLAYQAGHHAGVNIYRRDLLHPASEAVKVIASTHDSWWPRYSPNGKHIAFISNRSGNYEIWMSNSDGTGIVDVSKLNNPQTGTPSWSPDSQKILFDSRHNGHQGVYIVEIQTSCRTNCAVFCGPFQTLISLLISSSVRHSRVNASTTARMRTARPVARASQAKSTAHSWFERNNRRPSCAGRTNRFLLSRLTISRSSRYSR